MLAGISEENLLVQLEIEYQGDITSCNKVENYLQYSEYEYEDYSSSNDSSHVHSEQVTILLYTYTLPVLLVKNADKAQGL